MENQILELSLNDVEIVSNTRTAFDENALKELAASIKANGLLEPIIVKPLEGGKYRLICGERRFRAHLLAGFATIRAAPLDIAEDKILQAQIVENLQRKNLSTMEEVRAIQRLRDTETMSETEIAKAIGKAASHVHKQLTIARAAPELHEALESNRISRAVALHIAALDGQDRQRIAVAGLARDRIHHQVKTDSAQRWLANKFGAQPKRNGRNGKNGQNAAAKTPVKYHADWKYYLVRFSPEQFSAWQEILRGQEATEVWAAAVAAVMTESVARQAGV